jgi:hypothetical protein
MDSDKMETQPVVVVDDPQLAIKTPKLTTTSWLPTVTVPAPGVNRFGGVTEYE